MRRGLVSAAFAAGSLALYATPRAPLHMDTARDLLLARDCAAGIACHFAGPPASVGGVLQGGAWIHLLEACLAMHLGMAAVQQVVWALAAVSVGVVHAMAARTASPPNAAVATIAYAALLPWMVGHPTLWNPAILPLPAVLFFAALRAWGRTGGAAALALLAAASALLVDAHLVAVVLLAVTLAAALASRSILAAVARLALAAAVVAALLWLSSREALRHDVRALARHPLVLAGGAATLGGVAVVLAARWRRGATPDGVTRDACLVYLVLVVGGSLAAGAPAVARYVVPVAPGLALLFARAMERWVAAKAVVAALLAYHAIAGVVRADLAHPADRVAEWTLPGAQACAGRLEALGWTANGAVRSLDGPGGRAFVSTVAAFLPIGHDGGAPAHLLVEPRDGTCADVSSPVVDASRGERCVGAVCAPLRLARAAHLAPVPDYAGLAYPDRWELAPPPATLPYELSYRLPLVAAAALPPRLVAGQPYAKWAARADGSTLVVTHTVVATWDDDGWPPAVLPP